MNSVPEWVGSRKGDATLRDEPAMWCDADSLQDYVAKLGKRVALLEATVAALQELTHELTHVYIRDAKARRTGFETVEWKA